MKFRLVALMTISFLILLVITHHRLGTRAVLTSSNSGTSQKDEAQSRLYEYEFISSGRGITEDGVLCSLVTYQSMDGVFVFTRLESFRTAAEREIQFETKAESLSEIMERRASRDSDGRITGERIVGKHSAQEPEKRQYTIMRSERTTISYIESISLRHILDFENKYEKSQ